MKTRITLEFTTDDSANAVGAFLSDVVKAQQIASADVEVRYALQVSNVKYRTEGIPE